jgi:pimeloyl-ACP methyl ester carboxylesterase
MGRYTSLLALLLAASAACSAPPSPRRSSGASERNQRDDDPDPTGSSERDGTSSGTPEPGAEPAESAQAAGSKFPGSKVFVPQTTPAPAIVFLHGSEGGDEGSAAEFAKEISDQGFVVLSFCWFGCQGTPAKIHDVSLDRTIAAAEWLASTREVKGKKLGLFGWSRGGEQAVLLGSLVKSTKLVSAVAAHAPSDTIVCAFDPSSQDGGIDETDPATGASTFASAWTWKGSKLYGERAEPFGSGPRIAVEAYAGPMWISHGTADEVWEVQRSERIVASRKENAALVTEANFWSDEPHSVIQFTASDRAAWMKRLIAFYRKHL